MTETGLPQGLADRLAQLRGLSVDPQTAAQSGTTAPAPLQVAAETEHLAQVRERL
jgi:hypothetical protein